MSEPKWLEWSKQLQAIAQAGLEYSRDVYDLERFEQLRKISVEIMSAYSDTPMPVVEKLFASDQGYATPKVDVRAVVFKEGRLLMVKEKHDGCWALPGGWADIGLSPKQVAVKEAKEEAGYEVEAVKLLAVYDILAHPHPPAPYHLYKIFIRCEITGGQLAAGLETSEAAFFGEHELPELSVERNTESQIRRMFEYYHDPEQPVEID